MCICTQPYNDAGNTIHINQYEVGKCQSAMATKLKRGRPRKQFFSELGAIIEEAKAITLIENSEAVQLELEDKVADRRSYASAAIRHMLEPLTSSQMREYIGEHLLPFVASHLPNVHFQLKKCYALVLAAGRLVSSPITHTTF